MARIENLFSLDFFIIHLSWALLIMGKCIDQIFIGDIIVVVKVTI